MKYKLIKIIVFIGCILVPLSVLDGTSEYNSNYTSTFITPLNQRLDNSLSEFSNSKYIDYQINRFMLRTEMVGVSMAVVKDEKLVYAKVLGMPI